MSRVLVIDDDDMYRQVCSEALTRAGYEVFSAEDGAKGLRLLETTPVDLVITDIFMPNVDGLEAIVTIRKKYPSIVLIAMSGGGRASDQDALAISAKLGANAVLRKPFGLEALIGTVKNALQPPH